MEPTDKVNLLLVDDEPGIINALRRLLRPEGYQIFTAESGMAGLEILSQERIDLVISDMRMPQMDGATFLSEVRRGWPDVVRILLTGYADVSSTISAINQGEIYRYIAKPWDDHEIILTISQALEQNRLKSENKRLLQLTELQNAELKKLNSGLEVLVSQRTGELQQTVSFLELAQSGLKKTIADAVTVFSSLIEMRNGTISGHSRRVAEYARILGRRAGLSEVDLQNIVFASLLHDIGKIALPDRILERPFFSLPMPDQLEVMKHPVRGQMALMAIEQFKDAAILVRAHHERFDGHGYPDKSSGTSIPVGARIIAIANDFDALQSGMLQSKRFPESEARAWLIEGKGTRYDPELVELFIDKPIERSQATGSGVSLSTSQIRAGMVLASDLISHDGLLLLSKGHALSDSLVAQVRQYEKSEKLALQLDIEKSSIKGTV